MRSKEYNAFLEAYNNMDIDNLTDDELMFLEKVLQNTVLIIQRELRRRGIKQQP